MAALLRARFAVAPRRAVRFSSTSVLVVAEHNNTTLSNGTRSAVSAAAKIGNVAVLVAGSKCRAVADQASRLTGVARVLHSEHAILASPVAEDLVNVLIAVHGKNPFSHLVTPSGAIGKGFLPRLAVHFDAQPITDVISIKSPDTFVRPIYAGNALCTVQSKDTVKLISVRATAFEKATEGTSTVPVETVEVQHVSAGLSRFLKDELSTSQRPELASANVVVSGGRGMQNGENFKMLEVLADLFGGAVGASRAAVDAGFVPNELQVGQTGKVVAPSLYIAVGISGAIQHIAGMKDSKKIVAINKDPEAPIFQVADYGLVADLFKAVPELTAKVKAAKNA